jgi:hypothetical protein
MRRLSDHRERMMEPPPPEYRCDVPGCNEPIVKRVGNEQKCAVHALAKCEEWALAHDWRLCLVGANVQIHDAISALGKGKNEDAWTSWTAAFALLRTGHSTKRTLIERGFFREAGH